MPAASVLPSTSRARFFVIAALGCALLMRVGCLGGVEYNFELGDASAYRTAALTLADQGVYSFSVEAPWVPTAYRPPGYTAFLALVALVSRAPIASQLVQIFVSLATALLLFLIARRIASGTECLVLGVSALNPFDAVYAGAGLSECITTFLVVCIAAALTLLEGRSRLIWAGVLLGGLCLFRDIYLALIPFGGVLFLLLGPREHLRRRLGEVVVVGVVVVLMIIPWTARNFMQFGKLIPISAGRLGYSLWMGTWATDGSFTTNDATGRRYPDVAFLKAADREAVVTAGTDILTSEPIFKRLFGERMSAEPGRVFLRWLVRWPRLWFGTRFDIFELNRAVLPAGSRAWMLTKASLFALNALFVMGAVIGGVFAYRARSPVRWALLPLAFTSLVYLPLNSFENRYSQPMFPFLTLLLAFGLSALRARWLLTRTPKP